MDWNEFENRIKYLKSLFIHSRDAAPQTPGGLIEHYTRGREAWEGSPALGISFLRMVFGLLSTIHNKYIPNFY